MIEPGFSIISLLGDVVSSWPAGETKTLNDLELAIIRMTQRELTTVCDTAFLDSDELAIVRYMDVHPEFKRATFGFAGALSW